MRKDKTTAVELRKQGLSYNDIAKRLNISKSTLAVWFRGQPWSEIVKHQLQKIARSNARDRMIIISHRARKERLALYQKRRMQAKLLFPKLRRENLFVSGLALYWGEGDSNIKNGNIRISNSDPLMIRQFYLFVQRYLPEVGKKAKMYLILYPDLNDQACKRYWSRVVRLPIRQFFKSSYIYGRSKKRTLLYGVGTLSICSRVHKEILHQWIEMYKKDVQNTRV